jgi:hypothetical protein
MPRKKVNMEGAGGWFGNLLGREPKKTASLPQPQPQPQQRQPIQVPEFIYPTLKPQNLPEVNEKKYYIVYIWPLSS